MNAPDLENGYMVNTYNLSNRFQTFIEAVLVKRAGGGGGDPQYAYLSSPCRSERVSGDAIFKTNLYSFAMVKFWKGVYALRQGSHLISRSLFRRDDRTSVFFEKTSHQSIVRCDDVSVEELPFDDALHLLQNEGTVKNNRIYMRLDWRIEANSYALYTPCRYTNFPNPDDVPPPQDNPDYWKRRDRYIQPISGIVIFEENDILVPAHVAAHISDAGTELIEFCLRGRYNFFSLQQSGSWAKRLVESLLARVFCGRYFVVDEFHRIIPVPGTCTFYRYSAG